MLGQISNSTGHEMLLKLGVNPVEFIGMISHSTREGYNVIWCSLNEFPPNLTSNLCPVEFEIRPAMKYCSNWVEIYGFTPNSTGHEILLKLG